MMYGDAPDGVSPFFRLRLVVMFEMPDYIIKALTNIHLDKCILVNALKLLDIDVPFYPSFGMLIMFIN